MTVEAIAKVDSLVKALVANPDGKRVAVASGNTIKTLDTFTLKEVSALKDHASEASLAALFPDGSKTVSGSNDETIKIWDAVALQEVGTLEDHADSVYAVAASPDGCKIVWV